MKDLALSMIAYRNEDTFYTSKEERLNKMLDKVQPTYDTIALSWYLSKKFGVKLSPVIINSFLFEKVQGELQDLLKKVIKDTYTRPDFISNSLEFYENYLGKPVKQVPNSLKNTYTKVMESYSDLTLKKFKMKKKQYSLADLIKVLRPNPIKAKHLKDKELYKKIIENNVSLEQETLVDVLSNSTLSKEEKDIYIQKNLANLPINQIIRNLSNISYKENKEIVANKLTDCLNSEYLFRYLNPYDLIFDSDEIDVRWTILIDELLMNWIKKTFVPTTEEYCILFDLSGSMSTTDRVGVTGIKSASKFLSLIIPILTKYKFYGFNFSLFRLEKLEDLNKLTPNQIYKRLTSLNKQAKGGTHLESSLFNLAHDNPNANIIVVTDEVSYDNFRLPPINNSIILYCTDMARAGLFDYTNKCLRIAGHSGQLIPVIRQFIDFDSFMAEVRKQFKKDIDGR